MTEPILPCKDPTKKCQWIIKWLRNDEIPRTWECGVCHRQLLERWVCVEEHDPILNTMAKKYRLEFVEIPNTDGQVAEPG